MKFKKTKKGVSLVEVVLSSLIFSITAVGMVSTLSSMRQSSNVSERELQAAYYGRQLLDELRGRVDQSTWDSSWYLTCDNAIHDWPVNMGTTNIAFFDDFDGYAKYRCENIPPGLRQVTLNILWDEP